LTIAGKLKEILWNVQEKQYFGGLVDNGTQDNYQFLDFVVNPSQRSVSQQAKTLHLSKQSFDMLMFLLQKPGVVITKEELLAAVWPNRVITDSALNKQISQLRKTFDTADSKQSIIETVRGVGIRLAVNVDVLTTDSNKQSPAQRKSKFLFFATSLLLAFTVLVYFFLSQGSSSREDVDQPASKSQTKKAINVVVVPAENTDQWLDIGGLNYLTELLQKHRQIATISPQTAWFKNRDTKVLALKLSQSKNIDYALVIDRINFQTNYSVKVSMRNQTAVLVTQQIQSKTLNQLFSQVEQWTVQQLNAIKAIDTADFNQTKMTDFVLQSYLRGLAAAQSHRYTEAAQLLQTATNQNPAFMPAWLKLAEVEAELGYFQKALAITESIENSVHFDSFFKTNLYNIKAKTLIYLNQFDQAAALVEQSIDTADQNNDPKALIDALDLKIKLHDRTGINQQTLSLLETQLNLVEAHNPLPSKIAQLNHNMAIALQNFNQFEQAQIHIDKAIELFKLLEDYNALVSSHNVKANIHNILGETAQAVLVLEDAEKWLTEVDSIITRGVYLRRKASNLYEQGFLSPANAAISELMNLSLDYQLLEAKIMALIVQTELQISYQQLTQARQTVDLLLAIISLNPDAHPTYNGYIIALDMYVSARSDDATTARVKINNYLSTYPGLNESLAPYLPRIEAHVLAKEGFKDKAIGMLQKVMQKYIENQHYLDASYVGYELLDLLWLFDNQSFYKTINRIQELTSFSYPVQKYQARYYAAQNEYLNASILMRELKSKSREFWSHNDQLELEEYQRQVNKMTDHPSSPVGG
jgi:DNA-binding winged helix-turn-helix (wHTH) protein/tetratricopeptide (TPR) repeat protein